MKRKSMEWEKIFANDVSDKGLISQIYRSSYNSMPKTQTTQSKKIGRRPEEDVLPKKTYR